MAFASSDASSTSVTSLLVAFFSGLLAVPYVFLVSEVCFVDGVLHVLFVVIVCRFASLIALLAGQAVILGHVHASDAKRRGVLITWPNSRTQAPSLTCTML